jgi:hypothetical protein
MRTPAGTGRGRTNRFAFAAQFVRDATSPSWMLHEAM